MRRRLPLLAAAVAAVALATPGAAQASKSQYTFFEAPRELASEDPTLRAQTFDEIQSLGARHVRVLVYWRSVAPKPTWRRKPAGFVETDHTSGYDWSRYDRIVQEAAQRGIAVMLTPTGPVPRWATGNRRGGTYKPSPKRFMRFMQAAGTRYAGLVDQWSIWNEPNHPQFLRPQFVRKGGRKVASSPRHYRRLYRAALTGLRRSGNGGDVVLAGETAPRGTPRVVAPITFVRGFFRGKRLKVSGYAHHPYTTKAGPFYKPRDRRDVTIGVLSRLTRALDRHSKHRRLGLYLTEFGIQSKPDPFVGVSEARQAEYRSIAERIAYRNRRVRAFSQYLMRDDEPRRGSKYVRYSGFESGLRHSDGRTKLAYDAFRLPLVAKRYGRKRPKVALWGLVRPASGATSVRLEYRNRKSRTWRYLKTDATNARGYWSTRARYAKGRRFRVVWTAPNGTTYTGPATRAYRR